MRRNLIVTALAVLIIGGFALAYLSLRPTQPQQMVSIESASQTTSTEETTQEDGGMGEMSGMAAPEDVPRVPPVGAYYEGKEVFFIHTETSDQEIADLLTGMMGSPVLVVPELAEIPEKALSKVYVFTNGVRGDGPLGFQPDVSTPRPETRVTAHCAHCTSSPGKTRARQGSSRHCARCRKPRRQAR